MRFTCAALVLAYAATPTLAHADAARIDIHGNQRTRTAYIESAVRSCLGKSPALTDDRTALTPYLRQCLLNTRLFAEVTVAINPAAIVVTVEERWTLIPVPAVTSGSGKSTSTGLFLYESNFLGVGMTLALGGTVSSDGSSYFGYLADPSLFFSNWFYNARADRQVASVHLRDSTDDLDGFKEEALGETLTVGYRWDPWSLSTLVAYREKSFSALDALAQPEDVTAARFGSILSYEQTDFKLYFNEGLAARTTVQREFARNDGEKNVVQGDLQLNWQHTAWDTQALQVLLTGGGLQGGAAHDAPRLGGGKGFRGIDAKTIWPERYFALAVDYQVPILATGVDFDRGTIYDRGQLWNRGEGDLDTGYSAVGGGVYFFLKQVAIPGIGLAAGYNSQFMHQFYSVAVGLAL